MLRLMAIVLVAMLTGGCCCCFLPGRGGTWEDDAQNWERAFGHEKPDDVVVLHSWYWQSDHWTYEYEFYFEIEKNDKLKEELIKDNALELLQDYTHFDRQVYREPPAWFAPKDPTAYEVWVSDENLRLMIDKETGNLYLCDGQV